MTKPVFSKITFFWKLFPLFGSILFLMLYGLATLFYPGGSEWDKNTKGFSWMHNYWCNLLNETAINGYPNPARPIALIAMIILCMSLTMFWYQFPLLVGFNKWVKLVIQASGLTAMAIGLFLFTSFHDMIINFATAFGLLAIVGTFIGLWKLKWTKLFWMGILSLLFISLNNLLYYDKELQLYLPVVQKITFLYFLLWICLININFYSKYSASNAVFK